MPRAQPPDRPPQFIDVFELARTVGTVAGALSLTALPRLAASLPAADGRLRFDFAGHMARLPDGTRRPAARLSYAASLRLQCDRCGEPIDWPLANSAEYYFVASEAELARIPVDDAELEPLLGSARLDLYALVEDEALLALPMSPRHDDCAAPRPLGGTAEAPAAASPTDSAAAVTDEPGAADRPHAFAALARLKSRRS